MVPLKAWPASRPASSRGAVHVEGPGQALDDLGSLRQGAQDQGAVGDGLVAGQLKGAADPAGF